MMELTFKLQNDTKRYYVYEAESDKVIILPIYILKSEFTGKPPATITVTINYA